MADTPRPPRQERLLIKVIMPKQYTMTRVPGGGSASKAIPPCRSEVSRVLVEPGFRQSVRRSFRK